MRWILSGPGLASVLLVVAAAAVADDLPCEGEHGYSYLCDVESGEDLVNIPGTSWLVASGFSGGVSLTLIDTAAKASQSFYPSELSSEAQDDARFANCPGAPDKSNFIAHGLHIRGHADGRSVLYVVGHGARESIEVFDIDASGDEPAITWVGCVLMPDGMVANSVTSMSDGSLLATIPLYPGVAISEIFQLEASGSAFAWSPGDETFVPIEGTEMPYANGIEVSEDESEFYIASSGLREVLAFSNENPARFLRTTGLLDIIPDNLHRDSAGRMVTAGLVTNDTACGNVSMDEAFDLEAFAACPRPFSVIAVNTQDMTLTELASSPAHTSFSNVTMGVEVDDELWIGTFAGDRIAYRLLGRSAD